MKITVKEPTISILKRAMNDDQIVGYDGAAHKGFFKVVSMTWTPENQANGTCDVLMLEIDPAKYAWPS